MDNLRSDKNLEHPKNPPKQPVVKFITTAEWSGPLPPPQLLAQYDEIVPGAAERILVMAETQSLHRQSLEAKVIASGITNSKYGLIFGFILGLIDIIGGAWLVYHGHQVVGSIFGGLYLVGVIGVFVYGSQQRKKEREERR